jgi:hypothetical protein
MSQSAARSCECNILGPQFFSFFGKDWDQFFGKAASFKAIKKDNLGKNFNQGGGGMQPCCSCFLSCIFQGV